MMGNLSGLLEALRAARAEFKYRPDQRRDPHGRFADEGRGYVKHGPSVLKSLGFGEFIITNTGVKIVGSGTAGPHVGSLENRRAVGEALAGLPAGHLRAAGKVEVTVRKTPEVRYRGQKWIGFCQQPVGGRTSIVLHEQIPLGSRAVYRPLSFTVTATHEFGHALDFAKGQKLSKGFGEILRKEYLKNYTGGSPPEGAAAEILGSKYGYWLNSDTEAFAEVYAMSYGKPDPRSTFFGMGQARAKASYAGAVSELKSRLAAAGIKDD